MHFIDFNAFNFFSFFLYSPPFDACFDVRSLKIHHKESIFKQIDRNHSQSSFTDRFKNGENYSFYRKKRCEKKALSSFGRKSIWIEFYRVWRVRNISIQKWISFQYSDAVVILNEEDKRDRCLHSIYSLLFAPRLEHFHTLEYVINRPSLHRCRFSQHISPLIITLFYWYSAHI